MADGFKIKSAFSWQIGQSGRGFEEVRKQTKLPKNSPDMWSNWWFPQPSGGGSSTLLNGLLAYYKLDESSGNAIDATGNGHTGTVSGATQGAAGKINSGYSFDGSNDVVNLGAIALGTNAGSISAWIKANTVTDYVPAIGRYYDQHSILSRNSGYWAAIWNNTAVIGNVAIETTAYHHIVVTYDGSLASNNLKLYVDGNLVGQEDLTGNITNQAESWGIGSDTNGSGFWNGSIDEVAFYDRALTAAEVTELNGSGSGNAHPFGPTDIDLVVADSRHTHTADVPTITQVHAITVADATHSHSAETPTITQVHVITVQDATHGHTAETPAVTQVHVLVVQDATHGHTVDSPVITQAHVLTVQDSTHAHSSDVPAITQVHVITVQDANHGHQAESPAVTIEHNAVVQDSTHGHTAESPTVTVEGSLVVQDATHGHTAESPAITQVHNLVVQDSTHGHNAEQSSVTQVHVVVVSESRHLHTADAPAVTQVHILTVQDTIHGHQVDAVVITQAHNLSVQDALHGVTSDTPTVDLSTIVQPDDARHLMTSDSPAITQEHNITVQDATHQQYAQNVFVTIVLQLIVQRSRHQMYSDNVTIDAFLRITGVDIEECTDNATNDGTITIHAICGILPFRFSINGTTWQDSNVFTGVGAGTYTVYVRDANNNITTLTGIKVPALAATVPVPATGGQSEILILM